jgi:hypothetical protein
MPRDGSGVYTQPYPVVVAGTTIASAVFNGNTSDVAQDLNTARPIVAGGTGATSASAARTNLGAEAANQIVTDYNTFTFAAGSFSSAAGATAAPSANACAGICYLSDPAYVVLEARDWSTRIRYMRRRVAGTWDATWTSLGTGSLADLDTVYVNVGGDVMTGNLTAPALLTNGGAVTSAITATTGTFQFGSSGTRYLSYDGTNYLLAGATLVVAGAIYSAPTATTGAFQFGQSSTKNLSYDGTSFVFAGGGTYLGLGFGGRNAVSNTLSASFHNFYWTGVLTAYVDSTSVGTVTLTSDYRIKKDVLDLPGMWDTVKALRPIKYTQAEFSPPSHLRSNEPLFPADDIERWGFIAHELQETVLPSMASGAKDSEDTVQSLNLAPVVAALTKALQEAMARIEALEAGG